MVSCETLFSTIDSGRALPNNRRGADDPSIGGGDRGQANAGESRPTGTGLDFSRVADHQKGRGRRAANTLAGGHGARHQIADYPTEIRRPVWREVIARSSLAAPEPLASDRTDDQPRPVTLSRREGEHVAVPVAYERRHTPSWSG